jgi:TRAP transporter TAXI family solute receptor
VYAFTPELDAWQERRRLLVARPPRTARILALRIAIAIALLLAAGAAAYLLPDSVRNDGRPSVRLAVHRPGTVASLISAGLHAVLQRAAPDIDVHLVEQPGMIQTLRAMSDDKVDIGLAFNLLAFHAAKTEQLLGRPGANITALTVAYITPAQIVVRRDSPFFTIDDLKGKRISFGIVESGERFCSHVVLSHLGLAEDVEPHFVDFSPSLGELRAGRIDAYITWRGLPVPDFTSAFASGEFRLIPLEADSVQGLRVKHPFLFSWTIPARVYPQQTSPVPTVGARMLVLGARSLSLLVILPPPKSS